MTAETIDTVYDRPIIHPAWVRVCHWINAVAILVMIGSGWQIYNASPLFGFTFPRSITLGDWLAGAMLWHFAAMWVLVINGLVYRDARLHHRAVPPQAAADLSAPGVRRCKGGAHLQARARRPLDTTTRCKSCFTPA